jgi:hypothetical protein
MEGEGRRTRPVSGARGRRLALRAEGSVERLPIGDAWPGPKAGGSKLDAEAEVEVEVEAMNTDRSSRT